MMVTQAMMIIVQLPVQPSTLSTVAMVFVMEMKTVMMGIPIMEIVALHNVKGNDEHSVETA